VAFDERLAARVRKALFGLNCFAERQIFGGIGLLHQGNMICGVLGTRLILRVGPDAYEAALTDPISSEFSPTGRPMRGWITIDSHAIKTDQQFASWIRRVVDFGGTLDPRT